MSSLSLGPRDVEVLKTVTRECDRLFTLYSTGVYTHASCDDIAFLMGRIGDMISEMPDEVIAAHGEISWDAIAGTRNQISRSTSGIRLDTLTSIISDKMLQFMGLRVLLCRLLSEFGSNTEAEQVPSYAST